MYNTLHDSPTHGITMARLRREQNKAAERNAKLRITAARLSRKAGVPLKAAQLKGRTDSQLNFIIGAAIDKLEGANR